jgi:hypothetical protein
MLLLGERRRSARSRRGIGFFLTRPVRQSQLYDCLVNALRG